MTLEPCFLCGVDSVATCLACGQRVCNRHLIMSAGSLNPYAATSRVDLAEGVAVALIHPQGETSTALAGGSYLVGFAGGTPRCLACRERDGQLAVAASRDISTGGRRIDLASARTEVASSATEEESRLQAERLAREQALRYLDARTSEAVSAFLAAAAGITPQQAATSGRWVPEKRRFGIVQAKGRYEYTFINAYLVYSADSARVWVLRSGRVLFEHSVKKDRYRAAPDSDSRNRDALASHHVGVVVWPGATFEDSYVWSRKNSLPGLLPFYVRQGKPHLAFSATSHPRFDLEDALPTGDWFVRALASYLESHVRVQ
jgi:hypothetical protein